MEDEEVKDKPELNEPLTEQATKRYRRGTAIAVYLSQDRPDISAASCHLARRMQSPTVRDEEKLRRVVRYLRGKPRAVMRYDYQPLTTEITVATDSDWANDARSRRSHSGGVITMGGALAQPLVPNSVGRGLVFGRGRALCQYRRRDSCTRSSSPWEESVGGNLGISTTPGRFGGL